MPETQLNSGGANSLFSVEPCLARESTWPSILKIMRYVAISLVLLCGGTNANRKVASR